MLIFYILIFILGLILGSFLNVVVHRLPRGESVVFPASHCPVCQAKIQLYDNIPILSYLILRGTCRSCKTGISLRYPLIELLTGLVLLAVALRYGISEETLIFGILVCFLIPISIIDFQVGLILNKLTLSGFIVGVGLVLAFQPERWKMMLIGAVGGGLMLLFFAMLGKLLFKKDSLGMGDVKLVVLIGAYIGFPAILIAFYLGVVLAGLFILGGILFRRIELGETIPFGPFIALGAFVFVLWGDTITAGLLRLG